MKLIHGRYRILTKVGRGGFGTIYKARDTQLGNRLMDDGSPLEAVARIMISISGNP